MLGASAAAWWGAKTLRYRRLKLPRFYVDTFSRHRAVPDTDGIDLPDTFALEDYMRRALADIARDEGNRCDSFSAFARDEAGHQILTLTITFSVAIPPAAHEAVKRTG